jgi:hypothetical protein
VNGYFGGFIKRDTIDFELCSLDADKTLAVELRQEGTVPEGK